MAKKSKKSRRSEEIEPDGGAAVTLLSLSNIAKEEPSTGEELDNVGGLNVTVDDSDACSPPEVPDLRIPPLKKKKRSSDTVDEGLHGEEKKEKKKTKKRKSSSDDIEPGLNGEEEKETRKRSSDTVDAWLNDLEEKEMVKKRIGSGDTVDARLNDEERRKKKKKKKEKKKKEQTGTDDVGLKNSSGGGSNGEIDVDKSEGDLHQDVSSGSSGGSHPLQKKKRKRDRASDGAGRDVVYLNLAGGTEPNEAIGEGDGENGVIDDVEGEVKQDVPNGPSADSSTPHKKKRKRDRASDDAGRNVLIYCNPTGATEPYEASGEGEGAVGKSRRKKTVRFQEPANDDPQEIVTCDPREKDIEEELAYFSEDRNWKKDFARTDLLYGKFTHEEDEKLKTGVFDYIKMRGWDVNEGLQRVLHSSQHAAIARGCWLDIAKCLPNRPVKQLWSRSLRLLGGHKRGKWSDEEIETLKNLQKIHGSNWKKIASHMDRSADVCKDRWRHLKLVPTLKTGSWEQDEYDKLGKLVRQSLRVKESIPSKTLHRREVRDDINWEWIAEQMKRDGSRCADIWYHKLASPMIYGKRWANGDDRLLLQRLMELGASSVEALDWETVLEHRDGELCLERWKEMTRHLENSDDFLFEDRLELLAKRYAPDLLGIEEEI